MSAAQVKLEEPAGAIPNGRGAAAILAAGIGCAAIGVLALASDASNAVQRFLNFYDATGALSGTATLAIAIWLLSWYLLNLRWRTKTVALGKINVAAFIGLAMGLLLTFPPLMDLLQGK